MRDGNVTSDVGLDVTSAQEFCDAQTQAVCRGVLEKHARSFSAAAAFLTPRMRSDAAVAYAFCRLVDDAVDESESDQRAALELGRLEAMLDGEAQASAIVEAYMNLCHGLGIGLEPARDLVRGARSDIGTVRVADDAQLLEYCYRVAGTVGLMMCGILGVSDEAARRHAIDLGIGMQLTNICRDVLEDAGRGRVYLPAQRLAAVEVTPVEVLTVSTMASGDLLPRVRQGVQTVVRDLLDLGENYYQSGRAGFTYIPFRPRLAIVVAGALYREIGETLRSRGCDPLQGRARVPMWKKLMLMVKSTASWMMTFVSKPPASVALEPRLLQK